MCRRFALDLDWDAAARWLDVPDAGVRRDRLPRPSYNIAPMQSIALVAKDTAGGRHLTGARWSLVPRWSPSDALGYPTYNARVESARYKPTFADSVRSMRALIPATGYYEWKGRNPFYFHSPDGAPLAMAGLYSWWRPDGSRPWLLTATIITCPAVDGPASVHDRMPLLVPPDMAGAWLDSRIDGGDLLAPMREHGTALSRMLRFHEVAPLPSPLSTSTGSDGPGLIRPYRREEPMRLF
ncbi:SOS response-associated peptidase [Bifidobacterium sp. MA2]|uniref:Abasic site processing protein n=1 Tax=Bifidobacterium santillanense TaxID=2809028 RepID=A0ABS5UM06_9BIFI|nr:SOS response-associated peptidase [Bifidobacterium santillanense]MBT1171938.1 SOS response-associated peptidase [Bifidobacterium santillanense]